MKRQRDTLSLPVRVGAVRRRNDFSSGGPARWALLLLLVVFLRPVLASLLDFVVPYRLDEVAIIATLSIGALGRFRSAAPSFMRAWPFAVLFVLSLGSYLIKGPTLPPAIQPTARTSVFVTAELLALALFIISRNSKELNYVWRKLHVLIATVVVFILAGTFMKILEAGSWDVTALRVGYGREHPATLGYLSLVLGLVSFYYTRTVGRRHVFLRTMSAGMFVCMLGTLYISQTRGAWLAFIIAFGVLLALRKNWRTLIGFAVFLALLTLTLPLMDRTDTELRGVTLDNTQTLEALGSGRLGFWKVFWDEAGRVSPATGGGVGHAYEISSNHGQLLAAFGYTQYVCVHNDYLLMYLDFGVVGVISYCWCIYWPLWSRRNHCADLERALAASVCVASCVDNLFSMLPTMFVLVAVLEIRRSLRSWQSEKCPKACRVWRLKRPGPVPAPFAPQGVAG